MCKKLNPAFYHLALIVFFFCTPALRSGDTAGPLPSAALPAMTLTGVQPVGLKIDRIIPVMKSSACADSIMSKMEPCEDTAREKIAFDRYNEQLVVLYAAYTDSTLSFFSPCELAKACISRPDLPEIARNNLTNLLPQIKTLEDNGVYMVNAGGRFEASLILLEKFWKKENFFIAGEIVVAIPSNDLILITGSRDKNGLRKMKQMTAGFFRKSGNPLSTDLFVFGQDRQFRRFVYKPGP